MQRKLTVFAAALVLVLLVPAIAQARWGAIAIDPETGKIGYARNDPKAVVAKAHAKGHCGAPHCKVALWVFNGYGAVVLKKNGVYISGIGRSKAEAFRNARKRAREQSARSFAWVFSGYS